MQIHRSAPSEQQKSPKENTIQQYAKATSIHGIAYIFEEGRPIRERLFWIILMVLGLAFILYQSIYIYKDWQEDPIIITVGTTGKPIKDIDYPTITICPQGKSNEVAGRWKFIIFEIFAFNPPCQTCTPCCFLFTLTLLLPQNWVTF